MKFTSDDDTSNIRFGRGHSLYHCDCGRPRVMIGDSTFKVSTEHDLPGNVYKPGNLYTEDHLTVDSVDSSGNAYYWTNGKLKMITTCVHQKWPCSCGFDPRPVRSKL